MAKRRFKKSSSRRSKPQIPKLLSNVARSLALFLGSFSLFNILGDLRSPAFNANNWWIDFRPVQPLASNIFLTVASFFLVAYAVRPVLSTGRRILTITFTSALLVVTVWNTIIFYILLAGKSVRAGFPVAFSIFVSAALALVILGLTGSQQQLKKQSKLLSRIVIAITVLACCVGFPLAQMFCFGQTDYRRPADVIVVFGARVYADGRVSDALADRVRTGCQLYHDGLARRILFSGGPGDGAIHETQAMLSMALQLGVPKEAILIDQKGVNTQATVRNTVLLFQYANINDVLVVSHFYHLPRIKMSYQRQGWEVYSVPAKESYRLTAMPKFIIREIAALWFYYLRPLLP